MGGIGLQEKVQSTDFIKEHLMQLLSSKVEGMKERMAICLAHLLLEADIAKAYSSYGGGDVLLDMVCNIDNALEEVCEGPTQWEQAMASLSQVLRICEEREKNQSVSRGPPPPGAKVCCPGEIMLPCRRGNMLSGTAPQKHGHWLC